MTDAEKVVQFPDLAGIEGEAALWIVRLQGGAANASDLNEFESWQARGPLHREAFARLTAVWYELGTLKELSENPELVPPPMPIEDEPGASQPFLIGAVGRIKPQLAALVAITVAAALLFALPIPWRGKVETRSYRAEVGVQRSVSLADGSSITVDADSAVDVTLSAQQRDIYLIRGQAFFDVAPDRSRPFVVHAGDGTVRAVGTAFAVKLSEKGEVEVTVTKGTVELAALPIAPQGVDLKTTAGAKRVGKTLGLLEGGQTARFKEKIERLDNIPSTDLNRQLSWRQGFIVFSDESLPQVIEDISRYTTVKIEIGDPKLRDLRIDGYFEIGKVDALLEALERNFRLRIVRVNETVVRINGPT